MNNWEIIQFTEHIDASRGTLIVGELGKELPFPIKRVYYMNNVPHEAIRGGQRHKVLQQILIPIMGDFEVELEYDNRVETILMNRANVGLYIVPQVKRTIKHFSKGAVCMILASENYDAADIL